MRPASADARPVALTGMMAAGKSTVAAHLGRLLGRRVVSTDAEVERRAGKPIARIFAEDGEPAFRALEREVVAALSGPVVADLGGGAFCDAGCAEDLLARATVVFLDVSSAEAARRLGAGRGRPLAARWDALCAERLPLYRRAHHTVAVDGLTAQEVARRIADLLSAAPSPRPSSPPAREDQGTPAPREGGEGTP
jgi:shikimate kinase